MKRFLLGTLFLIFSFSAFGQTTHRYLVATKLTPVKAVQQIFGEELAPRPFRDIVPFQSVQAFAADLTDVEAAQLRQSPNVRWVEPDVEVHAMSDSVTSGTETIPYGVNMIDAPSVWPVTKGQPVNAGPPVRVAIVDTGITYDDPELAAAYKGGFNTFNNSNDPRDDDGHGTHVAGTIAAAQNGTGVTGIAPEVDLYSVKVLDACGSGSLSKIIQGIDWVIAEKQQLGGNWIMSLSLGADSGSQTFQDAFQAAADAGILVVAAAGNGYDPTNPVDGLSYPAAYPTVVSVGAIDSTKTVASFSQRGADLKLVAPGVDVLSTWVSEQLTTNDGHSFSADLGIADNFCISNPPVTNSGFVSCGYGATTDFPSSVKGKVALIQRGPAGANAITFADKAKNAKAAGAIAAVVYNNTTGTVIADLSSVLNQNSIVPLVTISQADGLALQADPNAALTLSFGNQSYANLDGTSMATPHVTGAAALVWSCAPDATADQVKNALLTTAFDLGDPGFDNTYGNGLVDAFAAAKSLAPEKFGEGAQPAPTGPITTGRRGLRRP